jgi:hypothetical protein
MKKIMLIAVVLPFYLGAQTVNLVKNGDAESGSANWNPKVVATVPEAAHSGANGFKTLSDSVNSIEAIPVDTAKTYKLSGFFKSADNKKVNLYFGLIACDAKNVPIYCHNINAVPDTDTELAEACQKGDTVLKIKDAGKWGAVKKTMVIACNTDPSGEYKDLPNRDLVMDITKIEFNGKLWEVTLAKECGKALPAGTNIRLHMMAGTFIYASTKIGFNSPGWVELTGTIKDSVKSGRSDIKFWPGTKSVKVLISSYNGSVLFDDIKLEEVADAAK